jgi:hypothetical protein
MTEVKRVTIGILNCETGKKVKEKVVRQELFESDDVFLGEVMKEGQKIAGWFDEQETFYSRCLWGYWSSMGILHKFVNVVKGINLGDPAAESVIIFSKDSPRGEEYKFYMWRED